jgi:CRISPR-associated protein Csb2
VFIIRVTFLMGRVYSAVFEDGDSKVEPEWPPHPSRFFSALVSAWGDGGAEDSLRPALEWLERQPPPIVHAGECSRRKLVQAFVPVNDSLSLPEDRARKARAFPSATLTNPEVYFEWTGSPPEDVLTALRQILQRTSSLGHSASLVEAEIAASVPEPGRGVWRPFATHGERMRVPHAGRLDELIASFTRFQKDGSKVFRPSAGHTVLYAEAASTPKSPRRSVFGPMIVLRRDQGQRASLRSALSITTALRGAMISRAPQPVPEFLSGHAMGSTPESPMRSQKPHVALVPLAFVDGLHATGDLLGVAAVMPRSLTREEQATCWDVFGSIEELQMPWGKWDVSVSDAEEPTKGLRQEKWAGTGKVWSTVTPFVFDRYPKDPFGAEAEQNVRDALQRVGLPEPVEVDLHYNPWHVGALKASAYPPVRARPGKPQRYHCHVWARFDENVQGPVLAGAGRYYGYGLFLPLHSQGARK